MWQKILVRTNTLYHDLARNVKELRVGENEAEVMITTKSPYEMTAEQYLYQKDKL